VKWSIEMMNLIRSDYIFFGFGKITNHLINHLHGQGKSIVCVTNQTHPGSEKSNLRFITRERLIQEKVIAEVAIFGWIDTSPLSKDLNEWLLTNSFKVQKSFMLSSASVYKSSLEALNEDQRNLSPDHMANKKYCLERELLAIFRDKGTSHTNLRISNVYGTGLNHGFIAGLLKSLISQSPANIYNQTQFTRDYISITDLCKAIEELSKLESKLEVLNVSTGVGINLAEILELFENLGSRIDFRKYLDAPCQTRMRVVLDCSLLKSIIQWDPVSLKIGISQILTHQEFMSPESSS
jgi:hypothetical protein